MLIVKTNLRQPLTTLVYFFLTQFAWILSKEKRTNIMVNSHKPQRPTISLVKPKDTKKDNDTITTCPSITIFIAIKSTLRVSWLECMCLSRVVEMAKEILGKVKATIMKRAFDLMIPWLRKCTWKNTDCRRVIITSPYQRSTKSCRSRDDTLDKWVEVYVAT